MRKGCILFTHRCKGADTGVGVTIMTNKFCSRCSKIGPNPPPPPAGYYAGYVASAFTFGRLLSGYAWGYVADSWGRKPVVIIGLASIAVLSTAFGLSESFASAVACRCVLYVRYFTPLFFKGAVGD